MAEFKSELLEEWQELRSDIDQLFYYVEEEDFLRKGKGKNAWSVKEVLYHINLTNQHYLEQMRELPQKAEPQKLHSSIFGRSIMKSMPKATKGQSKRKHKTRSKVDPRVKQKQGYAIVEKVVFSEMLRDLDEMKKWIEGLPQNGLHNQKLKTLMPLFKMYGHEALASLIRHQRRHIAQAEDILKS